jgi:hypothetical protein
MTTVVLARAAAVVDGVDVDAVADAVRACPAVADLHGGRPGGPATYLPGRQVDGVRVEPHALEVQVRARWGVPAVEVAAQIRLALRALVPARRVDVVIADLTDPAVAPPELDRPAGGAPIPVSGQDQWTRNNSGGRGDANSSGPITPTAAATPMSSSPA